MSVSVILFEAGLAVLIAVLIFYCIRLNRKLETIREKDEQITAMIASFTEASERAEASVSHLKEAGIAAERTLRTAIADAEAVRAELVRHSVLAPATASVGDTRPRQSSPALNRDGNSEAFASENRSGVRGETEQAALAAMRKARGQG
jgi:hypothetical protein